MIHQLPQTGPGGRQIQLEDLGTAVAVWINDHTPWGGSEFAEDTEELQS